MCGNRWISSMVMKKLEPYYLRNVHLVPSANGRNNSEIWLPLLMGYGLVEAFVAANPCRWIIWLSIQAIELEEDSPSTSPNSNNCGPAVSRHNPY
jgi:hypothetical protein